MPSHDETSVATPELTATSVRKDITRTVLLGGFGIAATITYACANPHNPSPDLLKLIEEFAAGGTTFGLGVLAVAHELVC